MISDKVNTAATWGMLFPPATPELAPLATATALFSMAGHAALGNEEKAISAGAWLIGGALGKNASRMKGLSGSKQDVGGAVGSIGGSAAACESSCSD